MSAPEPSREDLAVLLRYAGFAPTDAQVSEIAAAYPFLADMIARIHRDFADSEEPAHHFDPAKDWAATGEAA